MIREQKAGIHKKARIFWGLGILSVVVCFLVFLPGYLKISKLKDQISRMKGDINRLQVENENLRTEIEKLQNDPFTIEKIAREKLGLVRKGEIKLRFFPSDTDTKTEN